MNIFEVEGPNEEDILKELGKIYRIVTTYHSFEHPSEELERLYRLSKSKLSEMSFDLSYWKMKSDKVRELHDSILKNLGV